MNAKLPSDEEKKSSMEIPSRTGVSCTPAGKPGKKHAAVPMHDSYAAITLGYLSAGIAFGALAESLHVPYYFTAALSIFVYSGAVQSAFLGYWTIGIEPVSLILTGFLLNLRHTFYGAHIQNLRPELEFIDIISLSPLLTDETYAISVSHPGL